SFTWSVVTVLTHHWLESHLRILRRMLQLMVSTDRVWCSLNYIHIAFKSFFLRVVTVDTQPLHISIFSYLALTYYRNVVFCVTRNNTSPTSSTSIKVNRQIKVMANTRVES